MDMYLADNLRTLRMKSGLTLEAVSESIAVSRQSVSKWESGETSPDIYNCMKLAQLYKISLDDLVCKPLKVIEEHGFEPENGRMMGILELSGENSIRLPESLVSMFSLSPGDKLLICADRVQGIGLVKCSDIEQ